ncbi:unnamed protein product [Enterobius vermicularis]|uniref:Ribosomal_S10 domain-containing protein n=1 Tax=Enterobius vermicularis TaxID=51028 RepID=A0A0N4VGQ7_ENTVE|nr:unnamed protein product [Enterobius vermicularis]
MLPRYLYEPKFEDKREFPEYELLNVRLQGYDYVPLEKYQSFVHKIAKRFHFTVAESVAVSARNERAVLYNRNSKTVKSENNLSIYDRQFKIAAVAAVRLPLFMKLLQVSGAHLPCGVKLTIKKHEKADEEYRYIPDLLLKQKQDELRSLDDPLVRKALGWE